MSATHKAVEMVDAVCGEERRLSTPPYFQGHVEHVDAAISLVESQGDCEREATRDREHLAKVRTVRDRDYTRPRDRAARAAQTFSTRKVGRNELQGAPNASHHVTSRLPVRTDSCAKVATGPPRYSGLDSLLRIGRPVECAEVDLAKERCRRSPHGRRARAPGLGVDRVRRPDSPLQRTAVDSRQRFVSKELCERLRLKQSGGVQVLVYSSALGKP
mmetsp:Transcript_62899/g.142013  ORF Transcript_62899/g.142013 Transcript_62899/m.142013 type:complete len:216 (-) Transcript_62899:298-945(-)